MLLRTFNPQSQIYFPLNVSYLHLSTSYSHIAFSLHSLVSAIVISRPLSTCIPIIPSPLPLFLTYLIFHPSHVSSLLGPSHYQRNYVPSSVHTSHSLFGIFKTTRYRRRTMSGVLHVTLFQSFLRGSHPFRLKYLVCERKQTTKVISGPSCVRQFL
jgi:hypothetical protein